MYKSLAQLTKIKTLGSGMAAHIKTVAFLGVDAVAVGVKMHLAPCYKAFTVFGLPDKSVAESRERVRAALSARACSTALLIRKI